MGNFRAEPEKEKVDYWSGCQSGSLPKVMVRPYLPVLEATMIFGFFPGRAFAKTICFRFEE